MWKRFPVLCTIYSQKFEKVIRIQNKVTHKAHKVKVRVNCGAPGVGKTHDAYVRILFCKSNIYTQKKAFKITSF